MSSTSSSESAASGDGKAKLGATGDTESSKAPTSLPFEPKSNRKSKPAASGTATARTGSSQAGAGKQTIPEVVSQRMSRRMAWFSGVPMLMGMGTFIVSYFIVKKDLFPLPTTAVLLVSLGFFGLSVGGLSYGVFSASWDEERDGSWLGLEDFKLNVGRAASSWKSARAEALENKRSKQ
jgi:hypothetical protein